MARIDFEHIGKTYENGFEAVKDFNLIVEDGEFVVFVGPSGCGKSTTLRMLAGLEDITDGTIKIDGKTINDIDASERDIAMVFQNYALYPHMTVYENMAFALRNKKMPEDEIDKKIKQASMLLQISDYLDRKPSQLSGGQNQRVAVGRALVRNPKVFLMDEPLSNLDAKLRSDMRTEINKLHKELDSTFIYVTHDQVEAMTLGDRIVVLNEGVIQQVDSPHALYENPVNTFVAGFIGSPKINMLNLDIKEGDLYYNDKIFPVDESTKSKLSNYSGDNILIGIRPEHLHLHKHKDIDKSIEVKVNIIEDLGSEKILYNIMHDTEIIARNYSNQPVELNQKINLYYDCDRILFFDPKTGERIFF